MILQSAPTRYVVIMWKTELEFLRWCQKACTCR